MISIVNAEGGSFGAKDDFKEERKEKYCLFS